MITTCNTCGSTLSPGSLGEICPACLLASAIDEDAIAVSTAATPGLGEFGEYELIEEIGRGGMGVVYRARQTSLNRDVALKVLLSGRHSDVEALLRFRNEAESAAGLQHPNIVSIHDVGEVDGTPYLTMDLVAGKNLEVMCGGEPLSSREAASIAHSVTIAVQHAHEQGILHRDLKPSNVLIDRAGHPRVTDFGLAKRVADPGDSTLTGHILGSPNFMSPEQAAGRRHEIGPATDVYGIGALLYHLLTGRPPFLAGTPAATLQLCLGSEPVPPRRLNPAVPQDLETICLKCLEKAPARRFPTAEALAAEIERFQAGKPILARPVSRLELAWRWCRSHPAAAASMAVVLIALTGTTIVLWISGRKIEAARRQEHAAFIAAEENLYAARVWQASEALSAQNPDLRSIREHLDAVRPKPGMADMRGFEWRYLWKASAGDPRGILAGHEQVVTNAAFSPDGSRAATFTLAGTLRIWDPQRSKVLAEINGCASLAGFSADSACYFGKADGSIWRVAPASVEPDFVAQHPGRLVGIPPDGAKFIVFGPENLPVAMSPDGPAPGAPSVAIPPDTAVSVSRDGRRAAVAGRIFPGIVVVDLDSNSTVNTIVDPRPVIAVALSSDGRALASSGFDSIVKIWDVASGRLEKEFRAFFDPVWGMAFSPDGRFFAAGGHNRVVKVWDVDTLTEQASYLGHEDTIWSVAFSHDGERIISAGQDEVALIWWRSAHAVPTEKRRLLRGPDWASRTPIFAFSPDGTLFAGTAADGSVKVWRSDTLEVVASFPTDARSVAFSPDGSVVLSEGYDGTVRSWSLNGSETSEPLQPAVQFANWSVDPIGIEDRLAIVSTHAAIRAACRLCEIPNARDSTISGAPVPATTLAVTPDTTTMFIGTQGGAIEAWSLRDRNRMWSIPAHKLPVTAMTVSSDGRFLATGSLDNSTKVWETATGALVRTFHAHNRPVWALAFSPDGRTLASGSCNKAVQLFSVPLGRELMNLRLYEGAPEGYEQEVRMLGFSPDGNLLAAALGDGSMRFFRAATLAEADDSMTPGR